MSSGTVVVVTGAGRGIGRAVCERFARDGAVVVAAARTASELEETRRLVQSAGGQCLSVPTDVANEDEVDAMMRTAVDRFGRVDVLVNCAGIAPVAPIESLDLRLFQAIMAVNVTAVYLATRAVWPIMSRWKSGVIVNISSIASIDPFPGFAAYGAAKTWVNAWTKATSEEGRAVGIRVFAIAPGAVESRMLRDNFPSFPADQCLQPKDVAEMVHIVAEPACQYSSGQTIFVRKQ